MIRVLFASIAVVGLGHAAFAQDTLPDGPGKDTTIRLCSQCHEAAKATSVKLTREGWIETIDRMKAFGAEGTEPEFSSILEYLATHFKGDVVHALGVYPGGQSGNPGSKFYEN